MTRPSFSRLLLIGLLLVGLLTVAWAVRQRLVPSVDIIFPSQGPAVEAVYATGIAEPVHQAKVAPLTAARLVQVLKRDGDSVQAGDILAQLDDREAQGNMAQLAAKRDYLREELARQQALVNKTFISPSALSKLAFDLKQADAALDAARRPLSETNLRAPISGIVLRQDGEVGEMIPAGQAVFWVGKLQPLRITADVDEEDILRVKTGQKALLKADGLRGQALPATVADITEKGDSLNKNYRVRLNVPDNIALRTGMTVEVNILINERQNAWLVPNTALRGDQLWAVENDKALLKPVKVGIRGQDKTEILDGVNADTAILSNPPATLQPGQSVRTVNSVAPQPSPKP